MKMNVDISESAEEEEEQTTEAGPGKKNNTLPLWGNEKSMNLNPLILTNIQSSPYFKVDLYQLKTYHEVIDEIYYNVNHLEPWEKNSRKTAGQTGMCGGVRGVGAGGIVSTAFCILYKLFTLKLTRKQLIGLLNHSDSPYIRGLGFMYIRYTQPPKDLWDWFDDYLEDEEEVDVKAGSGHVMQIGDMLKHFLTKLEWYSTLFPRIPVPIQKDIQKRMAERFAPPPPPPVKPPPKEEEKPRFNDSRERRSPPRHRERSSHRDDERRVDNRTKYYDISEEIARERERQNRERDPDERSRRERSKERRSKDRDHRSRDHRERKRDRSRDRDRRRDRSRERHRHKKSRHGSKERHREKKRRHSHDSRSRDRYRR